MSEGPPRVTGVVETALYVDDLDRAEEFYRRLFGFRPMVSDERLRALDVVAGQVLLLFRKGASKRAVPGPTGEVPGHDGDGQFHLAFAIGADTVDAWRRRLSEHGVEIESEVAWPAGGHSLYFRDPDGHCVELASPGVWPNY